MLIIIWKCSGRNIKKFLYHLRDIMQKNRQLTDNGWYAAKLAFMKLFYVQIYIRYDSNKRFIVE